MSFSIVVMLSGNGSNLQAIIDSIAENAWPINIAAVISDKADAYGLQRAKQAGIAHHVISPKAFVDQQACDSALLQCLSQYHINLIVLAGYMRILSARIIDAYKNKIINLHPSLLPKYRGLHTHQRALENGDKIHGTTVHIVTAELDDGPILQQVEIPVAEDDTVESLSDKVKAEEHRLYPQVIYKIATSS